MTWFQRAVRPASIVVTALLIAGTSGPGFADGGNRVPFALIDHGGRAVTDTDFHGSYLLIFFGYTQCPDICPTDLAKMAAAIDGLGGDAARIQPLFVTIDPSRDTVAVLADYVGHFHPRLIGLTGDPDRIAAFAARYGVRSKPYQDGDRGEVAGDYFLDHTGAMYLLGPDGGGLSYFQHDVVAADITSVMQQFIARDDAAALNQN
ncbi:MAG: SCO family protein [Alphaproteobacteria bacterium]